MGTLTYNADFVETGIDGIKPQSWDTDVYPHFVTIRTLVNGNIDATNLGVTAGTATASKALVVDANRDISNINNITGFAKLASPALTGTPTAPTASAGTDTTQIATTAFVLDNAGVGGSNTQVQYNNSGSLAGAANLTWSSDKLTISGSTAHALTLNTSNDQKFALMGSTTPQLDFYESSTQRGSIIWHPTADEIQLVNIEESTKLRIGAGVDGLKYESAASNALHKVFHQGLHNPEIDTSETNPTFSMDTSGTINGFFGASSDDSYGTRIYNSRQNAGLYIRSGGLTFFSGSTHYDIWHSGNDGAGNSLDADLLDGVQGASYLRSDADDTMSSILTLSSSSSYPLTINGSNDSKIVLAGSADPYITFRESSTDKAKITWDANGYLTITNIEDGSGLRVDASPKWIAPNTTYDLWHSGNSFTISNSVLSYSGGITASGDIESTSDRRVKTDIRTIDHALDKVLQLRGAFFKKYNKKSVGVIAQEVEEILPEVVSVPDGESGLRSVAYGNMVGLLIEAIKEQQTQIDELKGVVNGS